MKKLAIGLVLSMVSVSAFANTPIFKTLADEKATFELCENYANTFNKNALNDIKPAFDILRPYYNVPKIEIDDLERRTNHTIQSHKDKIGDYVQTLHIDTSKFAKDHFIKHRFLLKRTVTAWYASCTFYRPKDEWQLHSFNFSNNPSYSHFQD